MSFFSGNGDRHHHISTNSSIRLTSRKMGILSTVASVFSRGGLMSSEGKHAIHVTLFISFMISFEIFSGGVRLRPNPDSEIDPVERYGFVGAAILYLLRFASLLVLPQCFFNMMGLILFNAFKDKIALKGSPLLAPFVCIR